MTDETGLIFHVIHGSFVDGYGIRTTVFLKGCPLRCLWCCNPEGQLGHPEIKLTSSLCNGCGRCVSVCPTNAIQPESDSADNKIELNRELCTNCGKCIEVCYTGALEFFGEYVTAGELFNLVKKDEEFYRSSGGGVTIGGGEPTHQPAFTLELLSKCRENHIHTALDTCGYTESDEGLKALREADLLLFDLKGLNPEKHLKNTGLSNEVIIKNLKELDGIGKPIIIRIPLIPGYTYSEQNIDSYAEFISKLKSVERVDLLAYHEYGTIKYEQLGREYKIHAQPPAEEQLNYVKDTFEQYGVPVQQGG